MKQVAVIILNFKIKKDTIECIKSVQKSDYKISKIIVVNNSLDDGLENEIKKLGEITFIQNKENLGFSGGNNVGIKYALASGADYIFILNPDAVVEKDTIKYLVDDLEKQKADIVSPKIYFWGTSIIWYAGGNLDLNNVLGTHRGVDEKDQGQYDKTQEIDFATGAAILVRKEVFEKIGLFDEKYFLYYEDSDFCWRAKQAGFRILYVPKAVVYHQNAKSTGLGSLLQDYFITRNRMLFASKFLPFRTRFALFREALKNITNPVRRLAFFDFLTGNFGQGSFKI